MLFSMYRDCEGWLFPWMLKPGALDPIMLFSMYRDCEGWLFPWMLKPGALDPIPSNCKLFPPLVHLFSLNNKFLIFSYLQLSPKRSPVLASVIAVVMW